MGEFMKKKLLLIIPLILVIFGISYAFYTYSREGTSNNEIVTGQIYLRYNDTNTLLLTNVFPETKEKAMARTDNEIVFTINGKNEHETKNLYYEIDLNYGEEITDKIRIKPEDVMIYLECDGEVLVDGISYSEWDEQRVWVETVSANTLVESTKTYTLKAWVSEDVLISDTNINADYTADDWNISYISLKISVYGDFVEKDLPIIGYITYDMSSLGLTDPASTPIYVDKTGMVTREVTSDTLSGFKGWSTTANGEVVYLPGDVINSDDITDNNLTLYPVLEKQKLTDAITSKLTLTTADSDGVQFVTGDTTINNYVTYSGMLWRIVAVNSDGSVKIVTTDNKTSMNGASNYADSALRTYLNDTFLSELTNTNNFLVTSKWDYTADTTADTTKPATSSYVEDKVGLLTLYEYMMTGGADSFLSSSGSEAWWTMTLNYYITPGPGWFGWIVSDGTSTAPVGSVSEGIRPSVVLAPNLIIDDVDGNGVLGDGSADNPYEISL